MTSSLSRILWLLAGSFSVLAPMSLVSAAEAPNPGPIQFTIRADELGGVVDSARGPEAGVWVIAETHDLPTDFIRIVVTDDRGRYLIPRLPPAHYQVHVRGYGLVDSQQVEAVPGRRIDLTASLAPDARAAAEYYPASYWFALFQPPPANEFPGTGASRNGIAPAFTDQQHWLGFFKENCFQCHQIGDLVTRTLPPGASGEDSMTRWQRRILSGSGPVGDPRIDALMRQYHTVRMYGNLVALGSPTAFRSLAEWTDRIAAGALPPVAPARPVGRERNVVVTLHGWAHRPDGTSEQVHDEVSSDKRDPHVNANGPVYGAVRHFGEYAAFDPVSRTEWNIDIPGVDPPRPHNLDAGIHNPMMDEKGRVWGSLINKEGKDPPWCSDPVASPYAAYFPNGAAKGRFVSLYDPATKQVTLIPTCFSTHHLNFARDRDDTLYFSGDSNVMGWIRTRVWDATRDARAAEGWCPMVLDTNGDGRIDPDRSSWNFIPNSEEGTGEGEGSVAGSHADTGAAPLDPKRDTRITGFLYGMNVSPKDGSIWFDKVQPSTPSGIVRLEVGAHPPASCKTEYYEPPRAPDGRYRAFDSRGLDVDSHGVVWVAFTSGALGRFDRSRCRIRSGPHATGQQCPEGWTFFDTPGPRIAGTDVAADFHYLIWVDLHDVFGLGPDVPIVTGTNSDSLLAFLPKTREWLTLRVPYPLGFYTRGLDGRVDDPQSGWHGRELWASYDVSQQAHLHIEGGDQKVVEFQLRPDPLAH